MPFRAPPPPLEVSVPLPGPLCPPALLAHLSAGLLELVAWQRMQMPQQWDRIKQEIDRAKGRSVGEKTGA